RNHAPRPHGPRPGPVVRGGGRSNRGGDRQRPRRGRDDDRPRRHRGPAPAPRPPRRGDAPARSPARRPRGLTSRAYDQPVQSLAGQSLARTFRERLRGFAPRGLVRLALVAVPALAAATGLVWLLETRFDVLNASPVYLLAVVITALLSGTVGALLAAVSGILIYDYLFTHPFQTFLISD